MEKWPSGRWQRFRKPSWVKAHREFESLLLRKSRCNVPTGHDTLTPCSKSSISHPASNVGRRPMSTGISSSPSRITGEFM